MMDGIEIFRHGKYDAIILDADINTFMFCSPMKNLYNSEVGSKPDILWQYIFFSYIQFSSVHSFLFFSFHVS